MTKRLYAAFFLLLACAAALAQPLTRTHAIEGVTEYRLANGLRVLTVPDPGIDTTTVHITYLVGSRHEGYGEKGMAHLLEHLLFKGSKRHPNIKEEFTRRGARWNGTTSNDRTNYFETFAATRDNLDWARTTPARCCSSACSSSPFPGTTTATRSSASAPTSRKCRSTSSRRSTACGTSPTTRC
jgi:zinc protease